MVKSKGRRMHSNTRSLNQIRNTFAPATIFCYITWECFINVDTLSVFQNSVEKNSSLINPLNARLNPICHLLALLGAHHILHVSRIRVNTKHFNQLHIVLFTLPHIRHILYTPQHNRAHSSASWRCATVCTRVFSNFLSRDRDAISLTNQEL